MFFSFSKTKKEEFPFTKNTWAKEEPKSKAISSFSELAKETSTTNHREDGGIQRKSY